MSFEYTTPAITKWRLDAFMNAIDDFENDFSFAVNHKIHVGQNYETILVHIVGKSLVTAREILTLCAHGYSDGALSLGRNLYEQIIILSFFEMHKNDADFQDYIDDFFLSYEVQRNKCFRDIAQYLPIEDGDALDVERENLKKRTKRKLKGDFWWTNCGTFSDLIKHIIQDQTDDRIRKFLGIHYMRYKKACVSLHASCMGNSIRIGSDAGMDVVDTSPSVKGQSTSLIYMAVSLISIFGTACAAFQIDNLIYLNPLNELAIFYQEREKEELKEQHDA